MNLHFIEVQVCGSGLVSIFVDEDKLFLTLPEPKVKSVPSADVDRLANAFGVISNSVNASSTIDVGAVWITIQLSNADEVHRLFNSRAV
jgi:predicted PhzF superfamily epimerase YddE/YHI9